LCFVEFRETLLCSFEVGLVLCSNRLRVDVMSVVCRTTNRAFTLGFEIVDLLL